MADLWASAVREAMEDALGDLGEAAKQELASLWHDLWWARDSALNGVWSMGCDSVVYRIVRLSRLVGSTPWEQIQVSLLLDGTYEGILSAAGVPFAAPDMERVREVQRAISVPGRDALSA